MKKIFSMMMALAMVMSASAGQQKMSKEDMAALKYAPSFRAEKKMVPNHNMKAINYSKNELPARLNLKEQAEALGSTADTAFYIASPDLVLYGGNYTDGYSMYPTLFQPYDKEVTFYNLSMFEDGTQFGWSLDEGSSIASVDTDFVVPVGSFEAPGYYAEATPMLMFESGEYYNYGIDNESAQWLYRWMAIPDEFPMPYTKCHMYTSPKFNSDGTDAIIWAWDDNMPYLFGTGLDLTSVSKGRYGLIDTIGTPFGIEGYSCEIDTISAFVASWDASSIQLGNGVIMTLYPIEVQDNTMYVDWNNPIASHTATAADITSSFTSPDGTLGFISWPIKATINGLFWIEINGMNTTNANFGFAADGMDNMGAGDTYMVSNDQIVNLFGMNLQLNVNATLKSQPTGLLNPVMNAKEGVHKFIQNGQMYIQKGNKVFNALGAEIAL